MLRHLRWLAALVLALGVCPLARGQNPPSLGDVARQARKDKEKNSTQPKTVITNDDLVSGRGAGSVGLGALGNSTDPAKPGSAADAVQAVDHMEQLLSRLDSLDRPTLVSLALKGVDSDFPNRRDWEQKMFAAKQVYVSHGRELARQMKELLASARALDASRSAQGPVPPDDPRAQDLMSRMKNLVRDAVQADSAFQAVILEGRDLATQAARR